MIYRIRAHHGMCFSFFQGKGYSGEFTENMWAMKEKLSENPEVILLCKTDDVCAHCPHNQAGKCTGDSSKLPAGNPKLPADSSNLSKDNPKLSLDKAENYDRQVLAYCGLTEGTKIRWNEFAKSVHTHILSPGKREKICGGCEWNEWCR